MTSLVLKEIQNLQGIVDECLDEGDVLTSHELHEQEIIKVLLDRLDECRGKLQFTNSPHFYMGRISALKECLKLYGVKV